MTCLWAGHHAIRCLLKAQALLLSVRHADTCIPVYIQGQKALSLLWLSDLTEIGSPMLIRVNNDVTGGLTNDQWSTPL